MIRKLVITILALSVFSCERKEVNLTAIDYLTLGFEKEWKLEELIIGTTDLVKAPDHNQCFSDDTILFEKKNLQAERTQNIYTWKKNNLKCQNTDGSDSDNSLFFNIDPSGKKISFFVQDDDNSNVWNIDKVDYNEIILTQNTSGAADYRKMTLTYKGPTSSK